MATRGTTERLTASFFDTPGGPAEDPTTLTLTIYLNAAPVFGPVTLPSIVKDGVGRYHYDYMVPLDAALGTYTVAWASMQPGDTGPEIEYETFEVVSEIPGIPPYNGCVWPVDPACESEEWLGLSEPVRTRSLRMASSTLHRLSGYRVTNCPITVRPGPMNGSCEYPLLSPGRSFYAGVGGSRSHRNNDARRVRLPGPIGRVDSVIIGTETLDPAAYRVEGHYLVRVDGDTWPAVPDLYSPLGSPNTWSVTYINGIPVDSNAAFAVGLLALEFARACDPDSTCALPDTVTTIVRQGVTIDIPSGAFPEGIVGIREVDAWIALYNPANLQRPATVYSPDIKPVLVVAGGGYVAPGDPDIEDGGGAGSEAGEIEEGGGA